MASVNVRLAVTQGEVVPHGLIDFDSLRVFLFRSLLIKIGLVVRIEARMQSGTGDCIQRETKPNSKTTFKTRHRYMMST